MDLGKKTVSIVVIGEAGDGKSTLCNTLTGKIDAFKESDQPECETKITSGQYGNFDKFKTFIVDTPGVGDPNHSDSEHLVKMIKYVKENPQISVIILVFNSAHPRFGVNQRRLLELFYSMAPGTKIHQHLAIIWTRWKPSALKELGISTNIGEKKKKFYDFIKEHLPQIPENEIPSIPQYFIDSREARDPVTTSHGDLITLLSWAYNKEPIQKIGIPFPKILSKNTSNIFILPTGNPNISLIGDVGIIDIETSYNLIPEELPIDVKLILEREIIMLNNNLFLVLTSKDSSKKTWTERYRLTKNNFSRVIGETKNKYYPLYLYECDIPKTSNYYICNSLKPKIIFTPFNGKYKFLIPDFSQDIIPKNLHLNFIEKEGKIFEIICKQLSYDNIDISLPGKFLIGPLQVEWEHNHQNKYSNCFVITENGKKFYKNAKYILIETGKEYTEGLWNQTHIKEPDKYKLGNNQIYMTKKIITKDPMPPKPTAPFNCNIYHDGDKTNGYNKGKPYGWTYHYKGSQMEIFRLYGKGWSHIRSDYANWGDFVKYSFEQNKSDSDSNGETFQCIW